jgi:type II secretory pathway pseudopilin PulG
MTISIPRTDRRGTGAFTLVEVIIAATLSTLVLAGVLSAFVFITRTGFRASGYSEMEAEIRRGLEAFARDARNATDVHWNNAQSVTFTLGANAVTYTYDGDPASPTFRGFYRVEGDASSGQPRRVLIHNVDPEFAFKRYKLVQTDVGDNIAANDGETKQLQVTLRAGRTSNATVGASNPAVSARYVLRNKRVAN